MAQSSSPRPRYSTGKRRKNVRGRRPTSRGPVPARRRGPAPILIIAVIVVLLVSCWIFGRGCGGNQEAVENEKLHEYSAEAHKLIGRSATVGAQFQGLRTTVKDLSRDDVARKLQQMVDTCKGIAHDSELVIVPEKAKKLHPILQVALDMRTGGVNGYSASILDVLDKKNLDSAADAMSAGMLDLVVSDRAMQRYRGGLEEKLKSAKFGFEKIADSIFMPRTDEALTSSAHEYIDGISGKETGNALHGVAVLGLTTTPARVDSTESGISILPYSKSFVVKVSVQNQGNQEEHDIPVVVTLTQDSGSAPQKKTQKITRLKAGETATLVFEDLAPATGSEKENTVKATAGPVPKEKKTDNNTIELNFIMRAE
ncbi:MAG: hypothetical protein CVT63_03145 [Candidatus Anoxymicrobium japonicum]|uniref:CARDB domain-containing protein n=1 Tax=Candidatus Anoxymicrobium japonicum TaxID=2013648 RepID=A0A2N3G6L2_9ACTN|nr:MAG: hypothetical protein CVT63_03145 [Candidatus Anoxymicrobium japonicum]